MLYKKSTHTQVLQFKMLNNVTRCVLGRAWRVSEQPTNDDQNSCVSGGLTNRIWRTDFGRCLDRSVEGLANRLWVEGHRTEGGSNC